MDEEGEHRSFDVIWKFHSSIGSVIIHTRKSSECDMYPSLPPQFTNGNPPIVYTKTEPGHLQQIYATAWKSHRIQSRTREILNDEGEYGSSNIGGSLISNFINFKYLNLQSHYYIYIQYTIYIYI